MTESHQFFQSFSYCVEVMLGLNVSLLGLGIVYMISLHFRVGGDKVLGKTLSPSGGWLSSQIPVCFFLTSCSFFQSRSFICKLVSYLAKLLSGLSRLFKQTKVFSASAEPLPTLTYIKIAFFVYQMEMDESMCQCLYFKRKRNFLKFLRHRLFFLTV